MKKGSLFLQLMAVVVAIGLILGAVVAYLLSVTLGGILAGMEKRPLTMVSTEIYDIASESFHSLLDHRKEDDPAEVAAAQEEVLGRIGKYDPPVKGNDYHFAVVQGDNTVLIDPDGILDPRSLPAISRLPGEGEIAIADRRGQALLVHHRYFPAWGWRLLTLVHEEDMRRETDRIKMWIFGSGAAGLAVLLALFYTMLRNRIQEPLRRLVARANDMVEGNYGAECEAGDGEVGELSAAFNRMSAAIRQREDELREVAKLPESNPNVVLKVTPGGDIVYANKSAGRMLAGMGLPMQHAEFLLPDNAPELVTSVSRSESRKKEVTWKVRGRTIEYTIFGFEDEDAVVFHGADVTERKQIEEQLLHSQKMETLGRIAGGVAHDFNNLLAGILGYASLLKSEPIGDPRLSKAIDSIEKAAERGSQLTRQLLGFSRKGTHEHAVVDLDKIVDETLDIVRQTFLKNIEIVRDAALDLPPVKGDGTQLHQCLLNLCINARDAMPRGGRLTVSTRRTALIEETREKYFRIPSGVYAVVTVSDDGHGMDETTQERIFDPFFTTKDKGKGTGLGMAMVYGIVKNHGGYITLRSAPGEGATFRIFIPATAEEDPGEAPPPGPPCDGERRERAGTALLVDDEECVREVGKAMLATLGYDVLTAGDGREAVEIYRAESDRISLTILDLMMPVMDGRKAFEGIRAIDPRAAVVVSTGFSGGEDVENLRKLGVAAILPKPYTFDDVTRVVTLVENTR